MMFSSLQTNHLIESANDFHPNIKSVRQIGPKISFLDPLIDNKNGVLAPSVYHTEATEPCIVTFNSDHVFTNIFDGILLRAMRY